MKNAKKDIARNRTMPNYTDKIKTHVTSRNLRVNTYKKGLFIK